MPYRNQHNGVEWRQTGEGCFRDKRVDHECPLTGDTLGFQLPALRGRLVTNSVYQTQT
jgi:hypothetical protein